MNGLDRPLRLGTRASPLAMAQAQMVRAALCAAHGWPESAVQLCPVTATGDRILDRALAEVGGKAMWTKELDQWLGEGETDISVHSMKDVETHRPSALRLATMLERADVRDRLIGAESIAALPHGARVGTSAPRRKAQLLNLRPDLEIILFRGNVATRLAKLDAGEADATLLAAAGLDRLGMVETGASLAIETMLPAPQQGAIGIECRAEDERTSRLLAAINHGPSFTCVMAERALLAAIKGDCSSPIAALAVMAGGEIHMRAEIYSPDGQDKRADALRFAADDVSGSERLAARLLEGASASILSVFG